MKNSSYALDIIVPHYKEPWETVQKFFAMLDIQRGVDFDSFRVILVNDGEENAFPDDSFDLCPYRVDQLSIPHAGVSAARNHGIRNANAEWVMFCDCDDMFFHPYAMEDIMNVLPARETDLLWSDFFMESKKDPRGPVIQKKSFNAVFVHGKLFRRTFLMDNDLFFDEEIGYCEDSLFCTFAYTMADENRVGHIVSQVPPYVWCDTEGSVTNVNKTKDIAPISVFHRNKKVCELYRKRRSHDEYCCMVARTVMDAYHSLNVLPLTDKMIAMKADFRAWFNAHKKEWENVPYDTLKAIKESSRKSLYPSDSNFQERITVTQWLRYLEKEDA